MSNSRRTFLRTGLLAALFAAVPLKHVLGQTFKERDGNPGETPVTQTDPLGAYSKASFTSYINSIFQLQTSMGVVAVTLTKVDDMPAPKGGECFSLLFRGGSAALEQDTYVIVHPSLGTFNLFLVPSGADQNGAQSYLATINRLSLADFANMTGPSRSIGSSPNSPSQASSPVVATPTPVLTSPTVTSSGTSPVTTVIPAPPGATLSPAGRKRKHKRIEPKTIN